MSSDLHADSHELLFLTYQHEKSFANDSDTQTFGQDTMTKFPFFFIINTLTMQILNRSKYFSSNFFHSLNNSLNVIYRY